MKQSANAIVSSSSSQCDYIAKVAATQE